MSYDNSELCEPYLSAYQAFARRCFKEVATGIVDWVLEVMVRQARRVRDVTGRRPDVGDDGDYWTWTVDEAKAN